MNQGWQAADSTELDGWLVRRNAGVTLRANSVLPTNAPFDPDRALDYVENLYVAYGITPSFQISPAVQPSDLDARLAARGYEVRNPTLVQCAAVSDVLAKLPTPTQQVNISTTPSANWTDCWWSVDGRGTEARATAEEILVRGNALYGIVEGGQRAKAIGRLALVDDTAGLYCLAVDEDFRRQGLASAVIHGLLQAATDRGAKCAWLSVLESNAPARTLYERLGFQTVSRYHYRVRP